MRRPWIRLTWPQKPYQIAKPFQPFGFLPRECSWAPKALPNRQTILLLSPVANLPTTPNIPRLPNLPTIPARLPLLTFWTFIHGLATTGRKKIGGLLPESARKSWILGGSARMIRWLATVLLGVEAAIAHAAPISPPIQNPFSFPLANLFSPPAQTPHPAVVRVVVQERAGMSLGSGVLVAVQGNYGLVLTNWHVVREAAGPITVIFPDGFRSGATILKLDPEWDLAALAIWRPKAQPIPLADQIPQIGQPLTILGYGSGRYRAATGQCVQYLAPNPREPPEMIELSVGARQGDSGGPILNQQGQLAGILFGSSWGRTAGSSCQRIRSFLETLQPWFSLHSEGLASAPNPSSVSPAQRLQPFPQPSASGSRNPLSPTSINDGAFSQNATSAPAGSEDLLPRGAAASSPWAASPMASHPPAGNSAQTSSDKSDKWFPPQGPLPPAAIPTPFSSNQNKPWRHKWTTPPQTPPRSSSTASIGDPATFPHAHSPQLILDGAGPPQTTISRFEAIKNFLAFVGAVALLLLAVRILAGSSAE